jgi:predicted component of type VI protein secretion system
MAYIIRILEGRDEKAHMVAFENAPIRVGRNQLNEVVLNEAFVSYWHGILQFEGERATYMDLGSTNGTTVNGRKAPGHTPIPLLGTMQDVIEIGPIKLSVSTGPVPPQLLLSSRMSSLDSGSGGGFTSTLFRMAASPAAATPRGGKQKALLKTQVLADATETATVDQAVLDAFIARVRPAYDASRRASADLAQKTVAALDGLDEVDRDAAARYAFEKLVVLSSEPELLAALRAAKIDLGGHEPVDALEWLSRLTEGDARLDGARDVSAKLAMERVGAVLETFASALVELRRGYEQFGSEMALHVLHEDTPLHEAEDARAVLRFALDPKRDGTETVAALREIFVDLAVHQVAMLSGVMAGVRDLLGEMSPQKLGGAKGASLARPGGGGLLGRLFPFRAAGLFRRYAETHAAVVEEDRFTRTVFGKAFAKAYFSITGGRRGLDSSGGRRS